MPKLEPCPFCGGNAEFERLGTNTQSCIVFCEMCGARLESNEAGEYCGDQWNRRKFALSEISAESPVEPLPAVSTPETDLQTTVRVSADLHKLFVIVVILVLVTGLQAGITIVQLLTRFGIIGGGA